MNKKLLSYLILFCALGLGGTAAYYSVIGLSKLFVGVSTAVLIMAGFLEVSKLTLAAFLHSFWVKINRGLRIYLTIAVISLSIITSMGIYGVLSSGYQEINTKLELIDSEVELINIKKKNLTNQLEVYTEEKKSQSQSINTLREGLSNNVIQYRDKESGQIITTTSSNTRRSLEKQLEQSLGRQTQLNNRIDSLNANILNLENQIIETKNSHDLSGEVGPLKYISEITSTPMNKVVNWLILIIVFVFDPLAISLVLAASFSFQQLKSKEYKIYGKGKTSEIKTSELAPPINDDKKPLPPEPELTTSQPNTSEPKKDKKNKSPFDWSSWRKNKLKREEDDLTKTY